MKRMKKFLAVLTAATLLATPFTALADSDSVDSESYLEGVTPDDVFSVQLPTIPANTYEIVLDPDKLLSTVATNQNASQNLYDPNATLLFGNASGDYEHSNTSDGASVVNTSMKDAVLTVNVTVTNAKTNPVTFVGSEASVSSNDTKNVYLAVVPGAKGTVSDNALSSVSANSPVTAQSVAVDTTGKASMSFFIPGQPANFELSQEDDDSVRSGHKYTYAKKTSDLAAWNTASFYLTGASNPNADWKEFNKKSQLTDNAKAENLKVKTVWSVTAATASQKADGASADATTSVFTNTDSGLTTDGSSALVITGLTVASITKATITPVSIAGSNTAAITLTASHYTYSNGTFTLNKTMCNTLATSDTRGAGTYKLTINGTDYEFTVTTP